MKNKTAKNYLADLGLQIKEMAREAKSKQDAAQDPFDLGYGTALYAVISLMQSQAIAFDIPLTELNLSDINPDQELL